MSRRSPTRSTRSPSRGGGRWRSPTATFALFDAHTHLGQNDPDGYKQTPGRAARRPRARRRRACGRLPDGRARRLPRGQRLRYRRRRRISGASSTPFCRVDPHDGAVAEATRALDAGARGIKLHPRAEGFTLAEPAVRRPVRARRRAPAADPDPRRARDPGARPRLGRARDAHPDARLILAHAAVSDLAWLWREIPEHPNLFIDTSWWNPGDMISLFGLVPPGQILWASDSPYGAAASPSAACTCATRWRPGSAPRRSDRWPAVRSSALLAGEEPLSPPGPDARDAAPRPAAGADRFAPHHRARRRDLRRGPGRAAGPGAARLRRWRGAPDSSSAPRSSDLIDHASASFPAAGGNPLRAGGPDDRLRAHRRPHARTPRFRRASRPPKGSGPSRPKQGMWEHLS